MTNISIHKIFHADLPVDYRRWKARRIELVSTLGSRLLQFSENELTSIFSGWESELREKSVSELPEKQMSCMMIISILHFFRRSFEQIKKSFPFIIALTASQNRNICKTAVYLMRLLMEESNDNLPFLKEALESAKQYLTPGNWKNYIFNSLTILNEVGKFLPTDVFGVTLSHFVEIWKAVCSDDNDVRLIGVKVINIHLKHVPSHTAENFAESLYVDCFMNLNSKKNESYLGSILVSHLLYKSYPAIIKLQTFLERAFEISKLNIVDINVAIFDFFLNVVNSNDKFLTPQLIDKAFNCLITSIKQINDCDELLKILKKLITKVDVDLLPLKELLSMIKTLLSLQIEEIENSAFGIIYKLLKRVPKMELPLQLFSDEKPCKNYIKSLSKIITPPIQLRKILKKFFFSTNTLSSFNDQINSLLLLKHLSSFLFDDIDSVYQNVKGYIYFPNEEVRIQVAEVLPIFKIKEANLSLIQLACFDSSKKVRICAIKNLNRNLVKSSLIITLLTDKLFSVRRAVIPLIASVCQFNPIEILPDIITYVNTYIAKNLTIQNPYWCSKVCSLFPQIAQNFIQFSFSIVPNLTWICVKFLLHGEAFTECTPDLRLTVHKDYLNVSFSQEPNEFANSFNLNKVYQIVNEKWIEKRDIYLFETLGVLSEHIIQFLPQIIPVYIIAFSSEHYDSVYMAAIDSLSKIVMTKQTKFNILVKYHNLLPPLIKLLGNGSCSKTLAISILKLIGTMGASHVYHIDYKYDKSVNHLFDVKNPSYFTSFVMKSLTEMLKKDSSPCIFEAICKIISQETKHALPFLGVVVKGFIEAIEFNEDNTCLFNELELIILKCESHIVPYLDVLFNLLKKHMDNLNCLRIALVLSYQLNIDFISISSQLYNIALQYFDSTDINYFSTLVQFICFSIYFQHQSFDLFLQVIESKILDFDTKRQNIILKGLAMIVQTYSINVYSTRLAHLCFELSIQQTQPKNIILLLKSLCAYCELPFDYIKIQYNNSPIFSHLSNLMDLEYPIIPENHSFIKKVPLKLQTSHLDYLLIPGSISKSDPFKDVPNPVFNNSKQWIEDLCVKVLVNSPQISIQSCINVINLSQTFRQELFPIAFFSCWIVTSPEDKLHISNIIKMIFQNFEKKDPELLHLADFLDRCGHPLLISDDILAEASESTAFSLFYLQRHNIDNPSDLKTIGSLLKLNSRMGRIESARGLLTSVSSLIHPSETGKWREELGEWEKALEIYESQPGKDISCFLRCFAHLELWDKIREKIDYFEKMDDSEKKTNAIWFAWAFYHSHDFAKVQKFVEYFHDDNDINSIIFQSLFLISSENYESAKECINRGFNLLSTKLKVFNGLNDNKASKNMVFAEHLIELQEVLNIKQNKIQNFPKIWKYRLQNFSSDSYAWTKLIEIRSLVLSPSEHIEAYLKMFSALREERRWKLIDGYYRRFFSEQITISFFISQMKIKWARGFKREAEKQLESFNMLLDAASYKEINSILSKFNEEDKQMLINSLPKEIDELTPRIKARLLRIQASWQYHLNKTDKETLLKICLVFQKSNELIADDYRTWAGWAYANSSLLVLSNENENIEKFTIDSISGFLKASQLRQKDSLEYLCQMFSIFFRYGEDVELPKEIITEFINLSPITIVKIIPQIVVHISHKGTSVKQIVSDIIKNFGEEHFQAVIFPLNVLSLLNDSDKAETAQDLIYSLGIKHPHEFDDVQIFTKGMHRAAVSILEKWLSALDSSSHAFHTNENETIINIINKVIKTLDNPQCEDDRDFNRLYSILLQRVKIIFEKFKNGDSGSQRLLWETFKTLYCELEEKLKKTDTIQLSKISEELAEKRSYSIAVPGTYMVDSDSPLLEQILPTLQVLSTQQHPRIVIMIGKDGNHYKFLLKGNEDLRLDQRIMQFFTLINSLLQKNRNTLKQSLSIIEYSIIPFAPNAGLISWVNGADTFQELVIDFREHRNIPRTIEKDITSKLIGNYQSFNFLTSLQRIEISDIITSQTKANELREILWLRSPSSTIWLQRSHNFTKTTALMSMSGYIIGLGDRHPSNIMIQRHTGRVIHIDFGDSFEVALFRKVYPERVPFRLTRMIQNSLDGGKIEGVFRRICEDVLWLLKENKSSIIAQLEVFIHEPIFTENGIRSILQANNILERVIAKLSGCDPDDKCLDVNKQVEKLINIATDPHEYIRHYFGWCPFW